MVKKHPGRSVIQAFFLFFLTHPLLLLLKAGSLVSGGQLLSPFQWFLIGAPVVLLMALYYIQLHVFPFRTKEPVSIRAKLLMGGRSLIFWGLYGSLVQIVYLKFHLQWRLLPELTSKLHTFDWLVTILVLLLIFLNGFTRIFVLSSRLRIVRRVVIMSTIWIPLVNLITLLYMRRIALDEFDHEVNKAYAWHTRKEKEICQTKYPLLLLHGVGFRDLKYLNYWGRIPRALVKNGADLYYGNQEAWGTVKANAEDVRQRILDILAETGAEKVNIIAHSKGGLDARLAIRHPDLAGKVASLTTISTPHRGCPIANVTYRLPQSFYRFVARIIDWYFRKMGDQNPDFYTACQQFSTIYSAQFNQDCPDVPGVYYQSYASVMGSPVSDLLLCIPYTIIRLIGGGPNDGLVPMTSAQWGNFRQVFQNKHRRGISHGDIIDLKRQDYRGFDVVETFVGIVAELKAMGY